MSKLNALLMSIRSYQARLSVVVYVAWWPRVQKYLSENCKSQKQSNCFYFRSHLRPADSNARTHAIRDSSTVSWLFIEAQNGKMFIFSGEIFRAMKEKVETKKFVAQSIRLWHSLIRSIKNSPDDEQFTARIFSPSPSETLSSCFSWLTLTFATLDSSIASQIERTSAESTAHWWHQGSLDFDSWWEILRIDCVTTKSSFFIFSFKWVDEHDTADEGIVADPAGSDKLLSVSADPEPAADSVIHFECFGSWGRQDQRNCDAFRVGSAAELCDVVDQHVVSGAGRSVRPELTVATENVGKSGEIIIVQA